MYFLSKSFLASGFHVLLQFCSAVLVLHMLLWKHLIEKISVESWPKETFLAFRNSGLKNKNLKILDVISSENCFLKIQGGRML